MNEQEFILLSDNTLAQIEESLDQAEVDFDYVLADGILTMSFDNGTKVIINRQTPAVQLWVASQTGGYHFDYNEPRQQWLNDKDGEELYTALSRYCSLQAEEEISLSLP